MSYQEDSIRMEGEQKSQRLRMIDTLRAPITITKFMIDKLSRLKGQSKKKERR
jgi:hypothetical protein